MAVRCDDTEVELVRLARTGDCDAFGQLIERHREPVYRLALRLVGRSAAEDIELADGRGAEMRDLLQPELGLADVPVHPLGGFAFRYLDRTSTRVASNCDLSLKLPRQVTFLPTITSSMEPGLFWIVNFVSAL